MKKNHPEDNFNNINLSSHQKIVAMVSPGQTVLDVGCASGNLAKELAKKGCVVTGLDIDPEVARVAAKYCQQIIVADVENQLTLRKLNKKKFDVVVFSDVLEHLRDPGAVLRNLIRFLDIKGTVIIVVPNIAFLTNRLLVLFGRFDYTDWGIMDKTHLRFFTKKSISSLIENAGLKIEKFDYVGNFTQLPLYMKTLYPIFGSRNWWKKIEYYVAGLWPEGLAVQLLFVCRKRLK